MILRVDADAMLASSVDSPAAGRSHRLFRVVARLAKKPVDDSLGDDLDRASNEGLVVEFDEAYTAFVEGFEQLPSEFQMLALQAVDTKLAAMVSARDATLWTPQARRSSPVWKEVRMLAETVLRSFEGSGDDTTSDLPGESARHAR